MFGIKANFPPCTGTKYNYFIYNKLVVQNKSEAVSMLTKAISAREKKLLMKISNYISSSYNIGEMIKKAAEKSRLRQGISAKWIINDSLGIIDIELKY